MPFGAPPPHSETPHVSPQRPSVAHDPAYRTLRRTHRKFGVKATAVAVGGFLLYVLLSSFAPALMNRSLSGHLTVGLALGLGQFVVMGIIVRRCLLHHRNHVTPVVRGLRGLARQQESAARVRPTGDPRAQGQRPW
ncbi:DUF485 domain-containing protein [Streptomyces sp. S.PB5]|uniref:DUF485 domain-containing protein n=1 Tax=Streptomyces sp. S.PB5 TaxID=3020844 RepID=UPI0025B1FED9|nr:DUF485 domain-containing protein [Streptomyces sp. S.PB5]MDN3029269.1 DUF485 domain-containing protein [Streptomyces sp. S.PB5]